MPGKGRPFPKGQSGNPAGKIRGTRNKFTTTFEELSERHGDDVLKRIYHSAIKGDMRAAKMVIERKIPPLKDRPIHFALPQIEEPADLVKATSILLQGVTSGEITPSEGIELGKLIDVHMKAIEAVEVSARLAALEAHMSAPAVSGDDDEGPPPDRFNP